MGAEPYWYFVPYESDINSALQKLREREFKAAAKIVFLDSSKGFMIAS